MLHDFLPSLKISGAAKACHPEVPTPSATGCLVVRAGVLGGRPFSEPHERGLGVPRQASAGSALAECLEDGPGAGGGDVLQGLDGAQVTQLFRRARKRDSPFLPTSLADRNRGWLQADGWEMTYTCFVPHRRQWRCATTEHTHALNISRPTEARIVLAQNSFALDLTDWTTWLIGAVGLAVAMLVIVFAILYGRWRRRRLAHASWEEDLPWDELLNMLQTRSQQQAAAGLPRDDELPPDQVLKQLLAGLPSKRRRAAGALPEDGDFQSKGGTERRASQRRWGNPTEVLLSWLDGPDRLHGLVINRSTGGLAVFVDKEVAECTSIQIRPAGAPYYVATLTMEVRHCRKIGRNYLLGCRFCSDVPWNVRVWFG
jgi:hypothetical protein